MSEGQRPKVVVAETISDTGLDVLAGSCDVDVAVGVSRDELVRRLADAQALIVRSSTAVDAELIDAASNLGVIGRAGIGVDNIDLETATRRGILVVNAPDASTISAAEHTMALLLAQARRIPQADASLRGGEWDRKRFAGVELHAKTLAVLGLGRIGTLVAQRALAFGMEVLAFDPYVAPDQAERIGVTLTDLDTALASADFVTLHMPRTRETEGFIDAAVIARMKPGVRIVNVARGGIIDETDLAAAIRSGHVAGAALDVFTVEPAVDNPLVALPDVVVTPHLGSATREAQDKAGVAVAEAVVQALSGELVLSAVNLNVGPEVVAGVLPFLPLAESLGAIFVSQARGLPAELVVLAQGRLADGGVRSIALGALKGALSRVLEEPVSYVNAPVFAEARGITVKEEAQPELEDYQSIVRLSGTVEGVDRVIAGTYMAKKGPVLTGVDGYEIEARITPHMLLVHNDDVPGVIGRVGSYLGDRGINITDMAVGRIENAEKAMMGLSVDRALDEHQIEGIIALDGVTSACFIDLT